MSNDKKRSTIEVLSDILKVAKKGAGKTKLVYGANTNFKLVDGYIDTLMSKRLLKMNGDEYQTTKKGIEFIKSVKKVRLE